MLSNGSTECTDLNDYLWSLTRDPTTLPAVWILFAFFYSLIIVIGVTGNLCVVLAISRTRSLQTVPNLFIFSLSCSDIMVCFTSAIITPITAFKKVWIFGSLLCSLLPFLAGSSLSFSTFILAAISIDRYVLIRFPMKKPFTTSQAFMVISIISILSMGISGPSALFHTLRSIPHYCNEYCFEDWGQYQGQKRAYGTILLAVQFILPLSIIVFCYASISFRLGHSLLLKGKKRDYGWQLAMSDQQRVASKRRQRTNRMFIAMVVAFSLSWIWNLLFNVLSDYRALPKIIQNNHYLFGITSHALAMTSTIWNPILYSLLNLQLRAAFIDLMPRTIRKCLMKDDEQYVGPRAHHRNVPSSMLLTAESRAFDRSGASTPIPSLRNRWLTPALNGPRNSLAFSSPIEDTNEKMESQLIGEHATQSTKYGSFDQQNANQYLDDKNEEVKTAISTEKMETQFDSTSHSSTIPSTERLCGRTSLQSSTSINVQKVVTSSIQRTDSRSTKRRHSEAYGSERQQYDSHSPINTNRRSTKRSDDGRRRSLN